VQIRLARESEPPIATFKTLPSPLTRAQERALARDLREAGKSNRFDRDAFWGFPREKQSNYVLSGVDDHLPIKHCLLLRFGRADLAEALVAAGTVWTPVPRARDLTDYGISYWTLAVDWAGSAFRRLINAYIWGEDLIALDAARRLARFRDLASAKADATGFPQADRQNRDGTGPAPRFYFLTQLDDLLRDLERRAKMPPRSPIPRKGGDPSARAAALIRDLDQIDEQQMMSPGGASPGNSPLVHDLIAEGIRHSRRCLRCWSPITGSPDRSVSVAATRPNASSTRSSRPRSPP